MEILAAILSLVTAIIALVTKFNPGAWKWLRKFIGKSPSKRSIPTLSDGAIVADGFEPLPRRRSRVDYVDPIRPGSVGKREPKADMMNRRPYPTTDATRPFAGGDEGQSHGKNIPFDLLD